ncbi:MAG: MgtC/SapB family protein [Candidatus Vogelbacteria bacterium]|nr:MgtC/SapB family protein [Candidatus Vogelbacteria bacterium]
MQSFFIANSDMILKLSLALLFGIFVGLERTIAGKQAGMRTYGLVTMGSCLFVLIAESLRPLYAGYPGYNPIFMASQIIVGIGFLGAGLIILQGQSVHGLTTAAGLWVAAGVGMAVGFGLYAMAFVVTVLTLIIFSLLWRVERTISPATVPEPSVRRKKKA